MGSGQGRPHQRNDNWLGSEEWSRFTRLIARWGGESYPKGKACMQYVAGSSIVFGGTSYMISESCSIR